MSWWETSTRFSLPILQQPSVDDILRQWQREIQKRVSRNIEIRVEHVYRLGGFYQVAVRAISHHNDWRLLVSFDVPTSSVVSNLPSVDVVMDRLREQYRALPGLYPPRSVNPTVKAPDKKGPQPLKDLRWKGEETLRLRKEQDHKQTQRKESKCPGKTRPTKMIEFPLS